MISVAVNLIVISFLIYYLYLKAQNSHLKPFFFPALVYKILAGVILGIIYMFYYGGGDTFNFFHDAIVISEYGIQFPREYLKFLFGIEGHANIKGLLYYSDQPRALFTSKILSLISFLAGNNYWISGIYLSIFSFAGMWYLASSLAQKYPNTKPAAAFSFLFFPSVVFWSSGVLKESLIMGSLSFLTAYFLNNVPAVKNDIWKKSLFIIFFLIILWKLKYYYLAVFLAVSLTTILTLYIKEQLSVFTRKKSFLIFLWFTAFVLFLGASTRLYPTLEVDNILFFLLDTHDTIYKNSQAENLIHYYNLDANINSFLWNIPLALFSGLFRPGIWDVSSWIQIIPALENLYILLSFFLVVKNINIKFSSTNRILLLTVIVYILILAVLMAFAAPNFGTLMRYKIGFLPFLLYILSINNPFLNYLSKFFKNTGT